jgi:hypothetical protein
MVEYLEGVMDHDICLTNFYFIQLWAEGVAIAVYPFQLCYHDHPGLCPLPL